MERARNYAERQKRREGYYQVKSRFGTVLDEIPLDFPDPASFTIDPYWLEYSAIMWMANSDRETPPTIDELQWRDRKFDEEVAGYRKMLEFFLKYHKRPSHLKGEDGSEWETLLEEQS